MDFVHKLYDRARQILPGQSDPPRDLNDPSGAGERMVSKYDEALIKRSLDGAKDDYSQPPVTEPLPRSDPKARKQLPAKNKYKTISVYSIVKHAIGKDLTHITMPLIINEPLSLLQRLAETLEYTFLLDKADEVEDPILRMELVMAFCLSCLSSSRDRLLKPFNPLLGETYQWEKYGVRLVSEQVSHHPPVSAFHVEGKSFTMYANLQPAIKFWGRSIEIVSKGTNVVVLKSHKEAYLWEAVPVVIKNLIFGTPYLEYAGSYTLQKINSPMKATVAFSPGGKASLESSAYEGALYSKGEPVRVLKGYWYDHLISSKVDAAKFRKSDPSSSRSRRIPLLMRKTDAKMAATMATSGHADKRILFRMRPRPATAYDYFNFGYFTLMLNELRPEEKDSICPTDSRFRPDMRLLERGREEEAQDEKNRIEDLQRARRRDRDTGKLPPYKPRWFTLQKDPQTQQDLWLYDESTKFWDKTFKDTPSLWR